MHCDIVDLNTTLGRTISDMVFYGDVLFSANLFSEQGSWVLGKDSINPDYLLQVVGICGEIVPAFAGYSRSNVLVPIGMMPMNDEYNKCGENDASI